MSTPAAAGGSVEERPRWESYAAVSVNVHLHAATALEWHRSACGGVVLWMDGTNWASLHLFADRAALARLIETASTALADLDAPADDSAATDTDAAPAA